MTFVAVTFFGGPGSDGGRQQQATAAQPNTTVVQGLLEKGLRYKLVR